MKPKMMLNIKDEFDTVKDELQYLFPHVNVKILEQVWNDQQKLLPNDNLNYYAPLTVQWWEDSVNERIKPV